MRHDTQRLLYGVRVTGLMLLVLASVLAGCQGGSPGQEEEAHESECTPACEGRECGADGCGGQCGQCGEALQCGEEGQCFDPGGGAEGCTETCGGLSFECGEVCGVACGSCGEGTVCLEGQCVCQPQCSLTACEQPDGCEGECGPCNSAENCTDCPLQLTVVEQVVNEGLVTELTLAVDYLPAPGKVFPTMADLRIHVSGPAELKSVGLAPAVTEAEKELFTDPDTGKPFRILEDGVHQILVFSTANTNPIMTGRWFLLRFKIGPKSSSEANSWTNAPALFSLVEREEILAPPSADAVLWGGGYSTPVVVWAQAVVGGEQ